MSASKKRRRRPRRRPREKKSSIFVSVEMNDFNNEYTNPKTRDAHEI